MHRPFSRLSVRCPLSAAVPPTSTPFDARFMLRPSAPDSPVVPPGRAALVEVPPPLAALDTPCHRAVVRAYRAAVQVGTRSPGGTRKREEIV